VISSARLALAFVNISGGSSVKMNLPLLALLLIPCAVSAESTWQGLVFGATAAQVRSALSRQPPLCSGSGADDHDCVAMTMDASPGALPGEFTVQPPLELWLPALEAPLHFNTLLYFFNLDRQLARIDLKLDTDRHKAEGKHGSDLIDYASEPVLAELLGKYGTPLEMSAACEPAEARRLVGSHADLDCNVLWKAQGQTVNLTWKYSATTKAYSLVVRYAWVQSGL
jgi:hypothetical protein